MSDEVFADPDENAGRLRGYLLQTLNFIFDPPRVAQALQ